MLKKRERTIFIGESMFSHAMLLTLINSDYNICGVISRPLRNMDDCFDLSDIAGTIEYWQTNNINDEVDKIKAMRPDIIYCLGFRQIIGPEILSVCPIIGFHPTPLPKMRGCSPIVWALIMKLNETASTFFLMDEGADSGDILSQERVPIKECDTVRTLYGRIIDTAKRQILKLDITERTAQDHSQATYLRKRIKGQEDVWLEY